MNISEKVNKINNYFNINPSYKPFNLNRVISSGERNEKEVNALYRAVLMAEEGIISDRIPDMTERDHQVFFSAIQWIGTEVGQEIIDRF